MPTVDLPVLTKILPASVHKAIPERVATLLAHPTILALSAGITISPKGYGSWNLPISLLVERKGRVVAITSMDEALALDIPGFAEGMCALQFAMTDGKIDAHTLGKIWQEHEHFEGQEGFIEAFFLRQGIALRSNDGYASSEEYFDAFLPYAEHDHEDPDLLKACTTEAEDSLFCPATGIVLFAAPQSAHAKLSTHLPMQDGIATWNRLVCYDIGPSYRFTLHAAKA